MATLKEEVTKSEEESQEKEKTEQPEKALAAEDTGRRRQRSRSGHSRGLRSRSRGDSDRAVFTVQRFIRGHLVRQRMKLAPAVEEAEAARRPGTPEGSQCGALRRDWVNSGVFLRAELRLFGRQIDVYSDGESRSPWNRSSLPRTVPRASKKIRNVALRRKPKDADEKMQASETAEKEEPAKEEPKVEEPEKAETEPAKEEPKPEAKAPETAEKEEPAKEEPKAEEEPKPEAKAPETAEKEEPAKEEQKAEEPEKAETEPAKEEPKPEAKAPETAEKQEPAKEEPKAEEPEKAETEPAKEEPKPEAKAPETAEKEEPAKEEPKAEEPEKAETEPAKEEPKPEAKGQFLAEDVAFHHAEDALKLAEAPSSSAKAKEMTLTGRAPATPARVSRTQPLSFTPQKAPEPRAAQAFESLEGKAKEAETFFEGNPAGQKESGVPSSWGPASAFAPLETQESVQFSDSVTAVTSPEAPETIPEDGNSAEADIDILQEIPEAEASFFDLLSVCFCCGPRPKASR